MLAFRTVKSAKSGEVPLEVGAEPAPDAAIAEGNRKFAGQILPVA